MQYLRKSKLHILFVLALAFILSGCQAVSMQQAEPEQERVREYITREEMRQTYDSAKEICLDDYAEELVIEEAGDYHLFGRLMGSIVIDAQDTIVHLFLDNVSVQAINGTALNVVSAGKVVVTCTDGTVNDFADGKGRYTQEEDACIYSRSDLSINGGGELNVIGKMGNAIHSKDKIKIYGTKLYAQGKDRAIQGNDGIYIAESDITSESEKDGLRTTKIGKNTKGDIRIENSDVRIVSGGYAINSSKDLYLSGRVYLNGIIGDLLVGGESYIEEGSLLNE